MLAAYFVPLMPYVAVAYFVPLVPEVAVAYFVPFVPEATVLVNEHGEAYLPEATVLATLLVRTIDCQ